MRFYFLHGGLLEPLDDVHPCSRSSPGDLIESEIGENSQVRRGLSGRWGQQMQAALERDGIADFGRLEFGPTNTAPRQLGL